MITMYLKGANPKSKKYTQKLSRTMKKFFNSKFFNDNLKDETFSIPSYNNINSLLSDLDVDGNNLVIVENLYLGEDVVNRFDNLESIFKKFKNSNKKVDLYSVMSNQFLSLKQ